MVRVYMYHPVDILFAAEHEEGHRGGLERIQTLSSAGSLADRVAADIAPRYDGPVVVETSFAFLRYSPVLEYAFVR